MAQDSHALATMLDPVLHDACDGRLGPIEWFHATWQRGGANTGFSTFRLLKDQPPVPVMVKLPVGPVEHRWTHALGGLGAAYEETASRWFAPDAMSMVTPRVLASGTELGSYDLAWVVVERLAGPCMPAHMDASQVRELLHATMNFHQAASCVGPVQGKPHTPNWLELVEKSREVARDNALPGGSQKWNDVLKRVQRALPVLRATWDRRALQTWCHGDLHPGNAMRRIIPISVQSQGEPPVHGGVHGSVHGGFLHGGLSVRAPLVLIDFALVHAGHWIEDALYLERQYWGHAQLLHGIKPVSVLAQLRRDRGLAVDDYAELANTRRVLMAASAPARMEVEGNPRYLEAALDLVERLLPQVPH
jgi:hypothetical protein